MSGAAAVPEPGEATAAAPAPGSAPVERPRGTIDGGDPSQYVRERSVDGRRDVSYPPAPEPLGIPVYDNHTHLEIERTYDLPEGGALPDLVGAGGILRTEHQEPFELDATYWDTERYDSERFGNLKRGVGLLVDLGEPVEVAQVELGMRPGADVELRAAYTAGATADDFRIIASALGTEAVTRLVPDAPVTARYFLVWFTRLPADGSRFQGSVGELFFVRP